MPDGRRQRRDARLRERMRRMRLMMAVAFIVFVVWAVWTNPGGRAQHIRIGESAWQHIVDRHTSGGSMSYGKSVFNEGVDIRGLIRQAERVTPVAERNGRLKRVVDADHDIGLDRATGRQTRTYAVITTQSGDLVTAFPGLP